MSKNKIKLFNKYALITIISKGKKFFAKIDKKNIKKISQHHWYLTKDGYGVTQINKKKITMHNFLYGNGYNKGILIDHINRNKLDNRKINIRKVTMRQNLMNRPAQKNNKSGIKGVFFDKFRNKWVATLLKRNFFHLRKRFIHKKDAAKQRKKWENTFFGVYNYKAL